MLFLDEICLAKIEMFQIWPYKSQDYTLKKAISLMHNVDTVAVTLKLHLIFRWYGIEKSSRKWPIYEMNETK